MSSFFFNFSFDIELPKWFIAAAFMWNITNEGHYYWICKDSKWNKFLKDKYPYLIKL